MRAAQISTQECMNKNHQIVAWLAPLPGCDSECLAGNDAARQEQYMLADHTHWLSQPTRIASLTFSLCSAMTEGLLSR